MVRPVCGLDNFCEETLESSFRLDYPAYEIIFCVARANDPVLPLVQRLIARHPDRSGAGDRRRRKGEPQSKAEQLRARMGRGPPRLDHSRRRQCIDAKGLYPAPAGKLAAPIRALSAPCRSGSRPRNLWAELECAFLNTFEARWQYCAEAMGVGFAQGKNMLWRRDIMEAGGGIRSARPPRSRRTPPRPSWCAARAATSISSIARSSSRSAIAVFAMSGCGRCAGRECGAKPFPVLCA